MENIEYTWKIYTIQIENYRIKMENYTITIQMENHQIQMEKMKYCNV
jgi:ribosomal protein L33